MKYSFLIVFFLFPSIISAQLDIDGKTYCEIYKTEKKYAGHHIINYNGGTNRPYVNETNSRNHYHFLLGLKYVYFKNFGSYVGMKSDFRDEYLINLGVVKSISNSLLFYLGTGIDLNESYTITETYSIMYSNDEIEIKTLIPRTIDPTVEFGLINYFGFFSIDIGIGIISKRGIYPTLGLGIHFK